MGTRKNDKSNSFFKRTHELGAYIDFYSTITGFPVSKAKKLNYNFFNFILKMSLFIYFLLVIIFFKITFTFFSLKKINGAVGELFAKGAKNVAAALILH